jgi:hypothetical protein
MLEAAATRIATRVPALAGRVRDAADFAALMRSNSLRDASFAAYVLPQGLRGGPVTAATGAFVQAVDAALAVVLVAPSADPRGARAFPGLAAARDAVIDALAGWRPPEASGPLRLVRGELITVGAGVLVYQIDLAAPTHLRIDPT